MPKYKLLNNIDHLDLTVDTKKSKELGDGVGGSIIFPEEFISVHKEYPIYFQKSAQTGEFQAIALFGFATNENLFLNGSGWNAKYIPALMRREPFLIGFQKQDSHLEPVPVVHIDMESPRLNPAVGGEKVFLENGGNTVYLNEVASTLMLIHNGITTTKLMFEAFQQYELIEPFALDVTFGNGERFYTEKYYTINKERLYELDDAVVARLHKSGHLQMAYMVMESLSNVQALISKKQEDGGLV